MKIISGENLGGDLRKPVGKKTPVIANNDFEFVPKDFGLGTLDFRLPEIRRGLRDARDVGKSKIFRDDRAPAVRAEFDLCHAQSLAQRSLYAKHCGSIADARKHAMHEEHSPTP